MSKPVSDPGFWRHRINQALANGWELHKVIYDIDVSVWSEIQAQTRAALLPRIGRGTSILDVGCGYGALLDCLYDQEDMFYMGIDISPDLLEIARIRHLSYSNRKFEELDATLPLPFRDQSFDLGVFRSMKDMVLDNMGRSEWERMRDRVHRVCRSVVTIEYEQLPIYSRFEESRYVSQDA